MTRFGRALWTRFGPALWTRPAGWLRPCACDLSLCFAHGRSDLRQTGLGSPPGSFVNIERESAMKVEGTVIQIRYRNEENGWSVFLLQTEDGKLTCVGTFFSLHEGEHWTLEGELVFHDRYGEQFQVKSGEREEPKTEDQLALYLAAEIPHIGEKTAKVLVQRYGTQVLEVLEHDEKAVRSLRGIGPKKAKEIMQAVADQKEGRESRIYLQSLGLGTRTAMAIYKLYGHETKAKIEENPYRLIDEVPNIGFVTADQIARRVGIQADALERTQAALTYLFQHEMFQQGSCYLTDQELATGLRRLLGLLPDNTEEALFNLTLEGKLIQEKGGGRWYLRWMYLLEYAIADKLRAMTQEEGQVLVFDEDKVGAAMGLSLNADQRQAVRLSADRHILVITGGPGTGKTTILRAILEIFRENGLATQLAAPTGRAAKRMEEATGSEALTLHRLLGYRGGDDLTVQPTYNEENPLACDAVIVDEASMVDLLLMGHLMAALPRHCRLVLLGDVDQLESVGPGQVLRDLIESQVLPVVQLQQIFRQEASSLIVTNAHRINQGMEPFINEEAGDFFFLPARDAENAAEIVVDLVTRRLPDHYGFHPARDIQVLAPSRRGPAGVESLNQLLQQALNPRLTGEEAFKSGTKSFALGDKVMQTKNNYQLAWKDAEGHEGQGIYNGDFGFVSAIDREAKSLTVDFDGRRAVYSEEGAQELEHAYAITVHKSQGSEFPCVVMPLVAGTPLLMTRNILYTGITRAKRICVLTGSWKSLQTMVNNVRPGNRNSSLQERLRASFDETSRDSLL